MNRATVHGEPFTYGGLAVVTYLCAEVGDGIGLHQHLFNHLTQAIVGVIEVYTDDGKRRELRLGDPPAEYAAGRVHGIRALTPGAMFQNIGPSLAMLAELRAR